MCALRLGFLTACLPERSLGDIAVWAAGRGYEALEVAAWPVAADRPYAASHVRVEGFGGADAEEVLGLFDEHGLILSSLAFYENNLHPDPDERARVRDHVYACVDAAALMACPTVGTFVGRDPARPVRENLAEAERLFGPLVDYAGERGVRIVIENCVMQSWHPDGYPGNLAYSPELWEWLGSLGLFLNFDPSHLPPIGIDPVAVLPAYIPLVAHVQAKDVEVSPSDRNRYGVFGKARSREHPGDAGWWRYRLPGLGQVDWAGVVDALDAGGFDGVVSIEHEDPVYTGSERQVEAGLDIAYGTLRPLIGPAALSP